MAMSLKEVVYQSILDDIVNDEFKPFQILSESSLVEKYKCSKSPVREALQLLCNDGVLRSIPRCGYEILLITREEIEQMLNARFLIEGGFIAQAMKNIQPEQFAQLAKLVLSMSHCQDDMWKFWDLNTQFHINLMDISGNSFASAEILRICARLKLAYAQTSKKSWRSGSISFEVKNHKAILAAIEKNDIAAARAAIRIDLMDFCDLQFELFDFFGEDK